MSDEEVVVKQKIVLDTNNIKPMAQDEIMKILFADNNKLLTSTKTTIEEAKGFDSLLALFSDGTLLVSETHKFDGRFFSFKSRMAKEGYRVNNPIYVSMRILTNVYKQEDRYANGENKEKKKEKNFKNQMQKEFVDIITSAAAVHVSDVHVVVADETQVMFRVDGTMQTVLEYDNLWGESFVRSIFASADISDSNYSQNEFQAGQKLGDVPLKGGEEDLYLPSNVLAIRLQFNPIAFGSQYLVMRLLYANTSSKSNSSDLSSSGFTLYELEKFYRLRNVPTGMSIVSGPTGSGKSTTLQRNMIKMLKEKNYEINLITVEDPPEYPIPGARQMPVTNAENEKLKEEAFVKALSAALRSDPDTMMVGEIRALSAAELCFKGALSGHQMWSTLHANSAPAIIMRMMDMGVDAFKLKDPDLMRGLIAQRLFKTICTGCRKKLKDIPTCEEYERAKEGFGDIGLNQIYMQGDGCEKCDFKGLTGRTVASEIILPDVKFLDDLVDNRKIEAALHWINELEGRTLREAAIEHMLRGYVCIKEVERWCGFINQAEY